MKSHVSTAYSVLGLVNLMLAVAAFFGLNDKVTLSDKDTMGFIAQRKDTDFRLPTFASGGAAGGFAIASGLCFVAAALANRWGESVATDKGAEGQGNNRQAPVANELPKREMDLSQMPRFPG